MILSKLSKRLLLYDNSYLINLGNVRKLLLHEYNLETVMVNYLDTVLIMRVWVYSLLLKLTQWEKREDFNKKAT